MQDTFYRRFSKWFLKTARRLASVTSWLLLWTMASSALAQTYGPETRICSPYSWSGYDRVRVQFTTESCGTASLQWQVTANGQVVGSNCSSGSVYFNKPSSITLGADLLGGWAPTPWNPRNIDGACEVGFEDNGTGNREGVFTFFGQKLITTRLDVTKSATPSTLQVGATGQYYTIAISITGSATTAPTYVYDALPTGMTIAGPVTATGGSLVGCPGAGSINLGTGCYIPAGTPVGTVRINIPISVTSNTASLVTNRAYVTNTQSSNCATGGVCNGSTTNPVTPGTAQLKIRQVINGNITSAGPWTFSYTGGANGVGNPTLTNNAVNSAGAVDSPTYTLSATGVATAFTASSAPGWYLSSANCTDTNAAVTGNPTGNLATASGSSWGPYTLTIPAANVRAGSVFECQAGYSVSAIRLITQMRGPRISDSDQFVSQVTDANVNNITTTTGGTGSTVTGGDTGVRTFNWGAHTIQQSMAPGSASSLRQYTSTVSCTNAQSNGTNVSGISKIGDSFSSGDGDIITCTITNTAKPQLTINQAVNTAVTSTGPWTFGYDSGTNGFANTSIQNTSTGWPPGANSSTQVLSSLGVDTSFRANVPAGWFLYNHVCEDKNAAATGNPTGGLSTFSGNGWGTGGNSANVITIPGTYVKAGANFVCYFTYGQSGVRVLKQLKGSRINAADQFTVQLITSGGSMGNRTFSNTTTGAADKVNTGSGDTGMQNVDWGSTNTIQEVMAAGSASSLGQYPASVSCTNAAPGGTNVSAITKLGDSFTSKDGDFITCTITNTPKAQLYIRQVLNGAIAGSGIWPFSYSGGTNGVGNPTLTNTAVNWAGAVNSPTYTLSTMGASASLTAISLPGWYLNMAWCTDINAAATGNPTSNLASFTGSSWGPYTMTIPAANVRLGAVFECVAGYSVSAVRLSSKLNGARLNDSDQFVVKVTDADVNDISATTAGTGSTLTGGDTGWRTFNWGSHTIQQTMAPGSRSALSDYVSTVSCTNAQPGTDVSTITKIGDSFTSKDIDIISCVITNTAKPQVTISQAVSTSVTSTGPWTFGYDSGTNGFANTSVQNTSTGWPPGASSSPQVLSGVGVTTSFRANVPAGWFLYNHFCQDTNAAISGNPTSPLSTFSGNGWGTGGNSTNVITIPGTYVKAGANFVCYFTYGQSGVRVLKQLKGSRINAADQFTVQLSTTGNTLGNRTLSNTTTGAADKVDTGSGDTGMQTIDFGSTNTIQEVMANSNGSSLSQYTTSVSCTNAASGGTTVSAITKLGDRFTSKEGDFITCTITNTPKAPTLTLNKTVASRANSGDQFTVQIKQGTTVTSSASTSGTASSASTGATSLSSGTVYTVTEVAAGTANLAQYSTSLSCSNANAASATVLPTAVGGTVTPVFGDVITCTITNTPKAPTLTLNKSLSSRANSGDQFTVQIKQGTTVTSSASTTGASTSASTGAINLSSGTVYTVTEAAVDAAKLAQYGSTLSCSNTNTGSATVLPTLVGGTVTPAFGDAITCTITNTPKAPTLFVTQTLSPTAHRYPVHVTYNANNGWQAQRVSSLSNEPLSGDVQTLGSPGVQMDFSLSLPSNNRWSIRELSCTDSNAAVSGNPSTGFGTVTGVKADKFTIDASNVRAGARLQCQLLLFAPFPY